MNLTDSVILKFQKGGSILFEDLCAIKSHTLGEIVDIGYDVFRNYIKIILMEKPIIEEENKTELSNVIEELSTFQYFLMTTQIDAEINTTARDAFKFFIGENVNFSIDPSFIIIGDITENRKMDEETFYEFRRVLKRLYFIELEQDEIIINKDDSPHLKKLKKQMIKNRKRVAKAKAKNNKNSGDNIELSDLIGSITFGGCNLNMENVWNITYYSFRDQLKRMGWHEKFDINNRMAMAGAKLKKSQLNHWIRNIANANDDK